MKVNRLIVAGFGGQGVMLLGQLLCRAAIDCGQEALFLPSYGPEQRGGTANCTVILSDSPIGSPVSYGIDALIAMNKPSLLKFQDRVRLGGSIFINSTIVDQEDVRQDVKLYALPVDDIANKIGSQKVANIVMLGAYARKIGLFSDEQIINTVSTNLGRRRDLLEMNQLALRMGMDSIA